MHSNSVPSQVCAHAPRTAHRPPAGQGPPTPTPPQAGALRARLLAGWVAQGAPTWWLGSGHLGLPVRDVFSKAQREVP